MARRGRHRKESGKEFRKDVESTLRTPEEGNFRPKGSFRMWMPHCPLEETGLPRIEATCPRAHSQCIAEKRKTRGQQQALSVHHTAPPLPKPDLKIPFAKIYWMEQANYEEEGSNYFIF